MTRVAIAGLGGYAAQHHAAIRNLASEGQVRLVATCDPHLDSPDLPTYRSLTELLSHHAHELDIVTLPVPIPLHATMHREVVEASLACYLEKPPTLHWPEFLQMLEVERRAVRPTQVGFNFIGDPMRQNLRDRIAGGTMGRLIKGSLFAIWPRDQAYYQRAPWAGRMRLGNQPVLDNPLGNALAHYVQNQFLFVGSDRLVEVRAQFFRAHPIESFDTAFVESRFESGAKVRFAATHADSGDSRQIERFIFEKGLIQFPAWNHAEVDGQATFSPFNDQFRLLQSNLKSFIAGVAITPLAECGPFVQLFDLAFRSAGGITDFLRSRIVRSEKGLAVDGLTEQLTNFAENGVWPEGEPLPVLADSPRTRTWFD